MKELILILALAVALLFGWSAVNQSAASKARARGEAKAMVIQAQGQSRLDSAQAVATTIGAMFPYAALTVMGFIALIIVVFGSVWVLAITKANSPIAPPGPYLIETRTIVLLPESATRRQMWDAISAQGESSVKVIEYKEG